MSNKQTLQQNNIKLSVHNNDLTSILNKINNLPNGEEVNVEKHYLDGTNLIIELSNNQILIIDVSDYINGDVNIQTVEEIEKLLVSYFESKTIEEVEK